MFSHTQNKKRLEDKRREFETVQKDTSQRVKEMDEKIQILQDTEVELKQLISERQKFTQKEQSSTENALKSQFESELRGISAQIAKLKELIQHESTTHNQAMSFMTWQREQVDHEIENFMEKFERDLETKTQELEDLKQMKEDMRARFEELQVEYEALTKKVDLHKQEMQRQKELRIKMAAQARAARLVQKWWRKIQEARKAKATKAGKKKKK